MGNTATAPERPHRRGLPLPPRAVLAVKALLVAALAGAMVLVGLRAGTSLAVGRMASAIRNGDDPSAARLVEELASFGPPAFPALVQFASSQRSAVALAARGQIDSLIDQWQQQAYLGPASFPLDRTALPLARALVETETQLTESGRRWLRGTLLDLLALAQSQDLADRLELIRTCDRGLTRLPADTPPPPFEPNQEYRLTLSPPAAQPETHFATHPHATSALPGLLPSTGEPPSSTAPGSSDPVAVAINPLRAAPPTLDPWPTAPAQSHPDPLPVAVSRATRVPARSASTRRIAEPPSDPTAGTPPSDNLPDLFAVLAAGDTDQQAAAVAALELRGFGTVSPREARMAASASAADRLALVNLAMTSPRLETGAWLWHLAHDPAGEVRAAAVASILTSGNQQLVAATLQLALQDPDPSVARQAELLRTMKR